MKCRLFYLHPDTNLGKKDRLEALHREYVPYVRICVERMLEERRHSLLRKEKKTFFPRAENLTSQIEKNAQDHAIQMVSGWFKSVYVRKMKKVISKLKRDGVLTENDAKALYTIGNKAISTPWRFVTQEHLDTYNSLLDTHGGNKPVVRDKIPMRLSEMTSRLEDPKEAVHADYWLRVSSLEYRKSIWLPLVGNPFVSKAQEVSKGIQARKTKHGRWRFEAVEKRLWEVPEADPDFDKVAVDVGLNVLATTSDGALYGEQVKPKFDTLYNCVRRLRANRQRQGLLENSPRLDCLEGRLTGMVKTETGYISNLLVGRHPATIFILEDLDLRGCKGQKRFAYRALQTSLERKAPVEKVNPAYTSQECPSCGFVHRGNRHGTKFACKSCGRKAHADWVGASGILRRSGDKDITCEDDPKSVKRLLIERYRHSRMNGLKSSSRVGKVSSLPHAPLPLGQKLTTRVYRLKVTGTASKSISPPRSDLGRF